MPTLDVLSLSFLPNSRRGSTASGTGAPAALFTAGGGTSFKGSRRSSIMARKTKGMASKTNTAMKQEPVQQEKDAVRVTDARGVDVTPRPLVVEEKPMVLNVSQLAAVDRPSTTPTNQAPAKPASAGTGEGAEEEAAPQAAEVVPKALEVLYEPVRQHPPGEDELCEVRLSESETILLFDKPNNCISNDHEDAKAVEDRNEKYKALLSLKIQSEKFSEAAAQTLDNAFKDKEVQESSKEAHSCGTQANDWGIFDAHAPKKTASAGTSTESAAGAEDDASAPLDDDEKESEQRAEHEKLLGMDELAEALIMVDRSVVQNNHHKELLLYRDFQLFKELSIPEHKQPAVTHLWEFSCEATEGLNVSCMVWNKQQKDMLVVGYGAYAFTGNRESNKGLIAVWSLRNPQYPEHIIKCKTGVTSMDFSSVHFNLLAVGMYDGTVSIYDLHSKRVSVKPIIESGHANGKHSDPVWRTKWIHRGSERGEKLVSISTDGRITQWSIKKGLEHIDLMKLKRIQSSSNGAKTAGKSSKPKSEAFISRRSSGMCFDFSPRDSSVYVAGTEEGNIHKCSCSYSEQYLESFVGHMGPVYQVIFSPFDPSVFLSSSADWSIKMWDEYEKQELLTFQSGTAVVNDVQWSPSNSTAFANVTKDGRLEIWDMEKSTLKPVVSYKDVYGKAKAAASPKKPDAAHPAIGSPAAAAQQSNRSLNCLLFNPNAPVVAVGTDKGQVIIFRLFNVEDRERNKEKQTERLRNAMRDNIMRKGR